MEPRPVTLSVVPTRTVMYAYCIVVQQDRVLLSRWVNGRRKCWTTPGAKCRFGAHPANEAARHFRKETGYIVDVGRLLMVRSRMLPSHAQSQGNFDEQIISLFFSGEIVGGELQMPDVQQTKTDKASWFHLDELPANRIRRIDSLLKILKNNARVESATH